MAVTISPPTGFLELQRNLTNLRTSQIPFAAALALTNTAKAIKEAEVAEVKRVFDRPTPFTLNAFAVVPATKQTLTAAVRTRGAADERHFLPVEVQGGARPSVGLEGALRRVSPIPFAAVIPARAASRDGYGNWSAGERSRVLTALQTQGPLRASGMMRSGRAAEFYIGKRGDTAGVWRRKGEDDDLILLFIDKAPVYEQRFDFLGVARAVAGPTFPVEFRAALARAMATAR